eukprot:3263519-Rhodomonas_salina.1
MLADAAGGLKGLSDARIGSFLRLGDRSPCEYGIISSRIQAMGWWPIVPGRCITISHRHENHLIAGHRTNHTKTCISDETNTGHPAGHEKARRVRDAEQNQQR